MKVEVREPAPPVGGPAPGGGRAGRNLPVATAVGLGLAAAVLVPLFTVRPLFVAVVGVAVVAGVWELARALGTAGLRTPLAPLLVGAVIMDVVAYRNGAEALVVTLLLTLVAVTMWRLADGASGYLSDLSTAAFVAVYVPFLAGFAVLLAAPPDGARRVAVFVATTACSDIGGYAAGVLAGRHPMAPSVSPKKTWEGFAGSAVACVTAGAVLLTVVLPGQLWQGAVFGLAVVATATVGDLGESMIKRDLGVKDMGALLPGHGGVMDRLDSLLPTAPVAWLLLMAFVPVR